MNHISASTASSMSGQGYLPAPNGNDPPRKPPGNNKPGQGPKPVVMRAACDACTKSKYRQRNIPCSFSVSRRGQRTHGSSSNNNNNNSDNGDNSNNDNHTPPPASANPVPGDLDDLLGQDNVVNSPFGAPIDWPGLALPGAEAANGGEVVPGTGAVPGMGAVPGAGVVPAMGVVSGAGVAPAVGAVSGAGAVPTMGAVPAMGALPGAGALPGTGVVAGAGIAPGAGVAPAVGAIPSPGVITGAGAVPGMGAVPAAGAVSGVGVVPGAGVAPGTGLGPRVGFLAAPRIGVWYVPGFGYIYGNEFDPIFRAAAGTWFEPMEAFQYLGFGNFDNGAQPDG
ncbi:hypothetical protein B0J18DRAFT_455229 [Chaetomium sp. MPI-SDFR-AT-0129]|nr:hypothetical protein B0J18DRAFT_455229 [Chaetomium sp. MPI-SDFR-AT-0129]